MHIEQKVWSNLSLRQQNYSKYATLLCCFVAKICRPSCGGPCSAERAEHA